MNGNNGPSPAGGPPRLTVIVPTYNSRANLADLLASLNASSFRDFEVIINDDRRSTDDVPGLAASFGAQGLVVSCIRDNTGIGQARKRAARQARGDILLHLDSDMVAADGFLEECVRLIDGGLDALVIPEEAFGDTFWARCKWLEKKCYDGVEQIESLRCVRRSIYEQVGGHDERLFLSEDKDLDLRVRAVTTKIGRTQYVIRHNEGHLTLWKTMSKKMAYARSADIYMKKFPEAGRWEMSLFRRYALFFRKRRLFFEHPALFAGLLFMKTCEFGAAGTAYLIAKTGLYGRGR